MDEKDFLKLIKSNKNREGTRLGENTPTIVIGILAQNKPEKLNLMQKIYNKIVRKYKIVKTPQQIVSNNFETIIDTFRDLSNDGQLDMDRILDFCNMLMEREDIKDVGKDIVLDNLEKIYPMVQNGGDLFRLVQLEKSLGREISSEKEKLLQEKKLEISKYILENSVENISSNQSREYAETMAIIIDELLESENCKYSDIISSKRGGYSQIYQIGNKILKVGEPRKTYEIPNHRRLLQPLTRTNLFNQEKKSIACVEIQEKVDPPGEITEDDVYEIYKELREDKIVWTDSKIPNLGRLRSDNIPTLNEEKIEVDPNSVGFTNGKNKNNLTAGDLIVIDLDFIYREDDPHKDWIGHSMIFEKRYQQEKAQKIADNYNKKQQETMNNDKKEQEER